MSTRGSAWHISSLPTKRQFSRWSQTDSKLRVQSAYVMLLHLPQGGNAAADHDALITTLGTLPAQLRRSLTWDQGKEMARHREFSLAADIQVYFCDSHSPWQLTPATRSNEKHLLVHSVGAGRLRWEPIRWAAG
jgi:IS30 family transposase